MKKINYILPHPIQYQTPLINFLTKKGIKLKVFYRSNISTKKFFDMDFNKNIRWDTDLISGHKYHFLNYIGPNKSNNIFPITTEFKNIFHNCEFIWLHGIKNWYNLLILFLNIYYRKKILIRDEVHKTSKIRGKINILFNKFFYKVLDGFVFKYLCIGSANKKYYLDHGINKKKLILMPYVVDNDYFFNSDTNLRKKTNILLASKFIKKKGIDIFLRSLIICNKNNLFQKNVNVRIVGDGVLRNELMDIVKKNKLTNVKLLRFKNQKSLKKEYSKSDIFILPSRYEPWGLTINEAMASSNVVVSSKKVGSSFDLIKNNYNGYSFKNENDLSKFLLKIFNNKKKINLFKKRSLNIIKKWSFEECYLNIIKILS